MIVSASRRTDIPAFYADWFMRRIEAGFCEVANPYNPRQRRRVSLLPKDVDAFVFWTRYPKGLVSQLPELDDRGFASYILFTLLDYPQLLDAASPNLASRIASFVDVSGRIGRDRVVWRYDPIVLTEVTDVNFHLDRFTALCRELSPYTSTVVVSLLDEYPKVRRRFAEVPDPQYRLNTHDPNDPQVRSLLAGIAEVASGHGLRIQSCAGRLPTTSGAISAGACIDGEVVARVSGRNLHFARARNQRPQCKCAESVDIGAYDTCLFDCRYCYAGRGLSRAQANHRRHDPDSASLLPPP